MYQWGVQAYKHKYKNGKDYLLVDYVNVSLYADNEEQALDFAKEIIKRPYYRVFSVVDYEPYSKTDKRTAISEEMLKELKKLT